jgi:hypothetical protein
MKEVGRKRSEKFSANNSFCFIFSSFNFIHLFSPMFSTLESFSGIFIKLNSNRLDMDDKKLKAVKLQSQAISFWLSSRFLCHLLCFGINERDYTQKQNEKTLLNLSLHLKTSEFSPFFLSFFSTSDILREKRSKFKEFIYTENLPNISIHTSNNISNEVSNECRNKARMSGMFMEVSYLAAFMMS